MSRFSSFTDHALDRAGIRDPFARRAVPPVVIAALVILIGWALGIPPHPAAIILLAITYVLYLLPRHVRRFALPATLLTLAVVYPIIKVEELNGRNTLSRSRC